MAESTVRVSRYHPPHSKEYHPHKKTSGKIASGNIDSGGSGGSGGSSGGSGSSGGGESHIKGISIERLFTTDLTITIRLSKSDYYEISGKW